MSGSHDLPNVIHQSDQNTGTVRFPQPERMRQTGSPSTLNEVNVSMDDTSGYRSLYTPYSDPHDELNRFATFAYFEHLHKDFQLDLAKRGFWYNASEDLVKCFKCARSIAVQELGNLPVDFLWHTKTCQFFRGESCGNISIDTFGDQAAHFNSAPAVSSVDSSQSREQIMDQSEQQPYNKTNPILSESPSRSVEVELNMSMDDTSGYKVFCQPNVTGELDRLIDSSDEESPLKNIGSDTQEIQDISFKQESSTQLPTNICPPVNPSQSGEQIETELSIMDQSEQQPNETNSILSGDPHDELYRLKTLAHVPNLDTNFREDLVRCGFWYNASEGLVECFECARPVDKGKAEHLSVDFIGHTETCRFSRGDPCGNIPLRGLAAHFNSAPAVFPSNSDQSEERSRIGSNLHQSEEQRQFESNSNQPEEQGRNLRHPDEHRTLGENLNQPQRPRENESDTKGKNARKHSDSRKIIKQKRNSGQEYTTKGKYGPKTKEKKKFIYFPCNCKYKMCKSISKEDREEVFREFWAMEDYDKQNCRLLDLITNEPTKSRKIRSNEETSKPHPKANTRHYKLNKKLVCKQVFEKTLGVNSGRITRLLKKKAQHDVTPKDGRGKHGNHPVVSDEMKKSLLDLVDKFPSYRSQYTSRPNTRYLAPGVCKMDVYKLCKDCCNEIAGYNVPTYEWFLGFWKENIHLKIHKPSTDCCSTCDKLKCLSAMDKLDIHQEKVEAAKSQFRIDAKDDHTITFDMQKTQPLPYLQTNEVFYRRQLWLYNLGIHHTQTKQGTMHCWLEGIAKRGSQEVGNCLLKFLLDVCRDWDEIILWSDGCGVQNRNINITSLLVTLVNNGTLKADKIIHRFMWNGHSSLPNDSDFSHIERKKNEALTITTDAEYLRLMKIAKKKVPFQVVQMTLSDFVDIGKLSSNYAKMEKDVEGIPFKFSSVHEMVYEKGFIGYRFRKSFTESTLRSVNLEKLMDSTSSSPSVIIQSLPILYPDGVKISHKKYNDLMELLKYIPPVHHAMYKSLVHDGNHASNDPLWPDTDSESDE